MENQMHLPCQMKRAALGLLFTALLLGSQRPASATTPVPDTALVVQKMESLDPWEMVTFTCLQGLANRREAKIYLLIDGKNDRLWLSWYRQAYGLRAETLQQPYDLFRYDWPIAGYCLMDPEVKHTANLAANYAATENLLPVTRAMLDKHPEMPDLPIKRDLTGRFVGATAEQAYTWAYQHQWDRLELNRSVVGNTMAPDRSLPPFYQRQAIRDYVVARGGFLFELSADPRHAGEHALRNKFMAEMDDWGYLMGWHVDRDKEPQHVQQATDHHQLVLCSNTAPNFSFHQHVGPDQPDFVQQHQLHSMDQVSLDQDQIYLTFYFSDGDSLNWISRGAHGGRWADRGKIPMGWEVQPVMLDVAPGMLDYFYKTATANDVLVASASGIGYNHPERFSADRLREYLSLSKTYYQKLDLKSLIVLIGPEKRTTGLAQDTIDIYGESLGDTLLGVFESYTALETSPRLVDGMVWMPTRLPYSNIPKRKPAGAYQDLVEIIRASDTRPLFIPFHINKGHMSYRDAVKMLEKAQQEFPAEIRCVRPDEFFLLYNKWAKGSAVGTTE